MVVDGSFFASNISINLGNPKVTLIPTEPAKWKVRMVICVAGSDMDWAEIIPMLSPGSKELFIYSLLTASITFLFLTELSFLSLQIFFISSNILLGNNSSEYSVCDSFDINSTFLYF